MIERATKFIQFFKNPSFHNTRLFDLVIIGFFLYLLTPASLFHNLVIGLDGSWMMAVHWATEKELVFGKEFIFTYGPLGFLVVRLPSTINNLYYVVFDLYILCNIGFILYYILATYKSLISYCIIYISIIILGNFYDHNMVMFLLWILLFMIFYCIQHRNTFVLVNIFFITLLLFFIKVNISLVATFFFCSFLTYSWYHKIFSFKKSILLLSLYIALIFLFSFILHVNLSGYIVGSLHLIDAYNDAMYVPFKLESTIFIAALFIIGLYFSIFIKKLIFFSKNIWSLYVYFVVAATIYIIYKQGFTRLHTEDFFRNISLFIGLLVLFSKESIKQTMLMVFLISSFIAFTSIRSATNLFDIDSFISKKENIKSYLLAISNTSQVNDHNLITQRQIPEHIKKQIGNSSVDIVPWEISYIILNKLNYHPRPVIQTYAAYDKYLDNINYERYMSVDAPEYILFKLETIDNRLAFHDETLTKLAILINYQVIDKSWAYLLLKKKDQPQQNSVVKTETRVFKLGNDISIKESNELQLFSAKIKYSLLGKLWRLFVQAPQLHISLVLEDGSEYTYRAIKPILEGGILINKFIQNSSDNTTANNYVLELFFNSAGLKNNTVTRINIYTDTPWAFKDEFVAKIEFINIKSDPDLLDRYKVAQVSLPEAGNNIIGNVDFIQASGKYLEVSGWACINGANSNNLKPYIVLKSKQHTFAYQADKVIRRDVTAIINNGINLDSSGYRALILKDNLPKNDYSIGIYLTKDDSLEAFSLTDKTLIEPIHTDPFVTDEKLPAASDNIAYWIDDITHARKFLALKGWAYIKNKNSNDTKTFIVLKSSEETYIFQTNIEKRPDVSIMHANPHLDDSGFSISLGKEKIKPGKYKIGIAVSVNNQIQEFLLTEKSVDI